MKQGDRIDLVTFTDHILCTKQNEPMRTVVSGGKVLDTAVEITYFSETLLQMYCKPRNGQPYLQFIPWAVVAGAFAPVPAE